MLDPKFVAELMETTLTVVKSSTDGGSYETFKAKMFLASTTEVGLANENNIAEGSLLALFSNDASRVAYPTAQCVNNADGYTNSGFATSKGWYWWLRTPNSSNANYVRCVYSDGSLCSNYADYGGYGVRPLCNLKSEILVSYLNGENAEEQKKRAEAVDMMKHIAAAWDIDAEEVFGRADE